MSVTPSRPETASIEAVGRGVSAVLRCPSCRSELHDTRAGSDDVDRVACTGCGAAWPVRWGIPDLRPPGVTDPYLTLDEDLRAAEQLVRRAEDTDVSGLLSSYYETNARVPAAQARRFTVGAMAAIGRAEAALRAWQAMSGPGSGPPATLLDVGCGTGPLSVAAQFAGYTTMAMDVGLRWLVIARARARDAGIHLTTVCAGAERLPFADGAIDVVASEYLLENIVPAGPLFAESARVLRPGGRFWCATANRWTPAPDPHLGVPFGAWWPEWLAARYARLRGAVPPRRRLLGARGLRQALRRQGFVRTRLLPAPIAESQRAGVGPVARIAIAGYRRVADAAPGRVLLTLVAPSLLGTAERPAGHPATS